MRNNFFAIAFSLSADILSDLSHGGAAIYQIWQPYYLLHLKYPRIQLFLSALFKKFWTPPN